MRLFPGQYLLLLALLSSYAVNAHLVKRDAPTNSSATDPPGSGGPDTSSLQTLLQGLLSFVQQIPLVGNLLAQVLESVVELILAVELLTNGALSRVLGGALPCIVSLGDHFQCTGITKNGGLTQLLENTIDTLPTLLVPSVLKELLKTLIRGLLDPLLDVLFGGQQVLKA